MKIAACKAQALPASVLLQPRFQHRHDNHPLRVHKDKHLCVIITANTQQRANLLCIRNLPQIFVPPGCLGTYLFNVHRVLIVFRGLMTGDVVSSVASDSAVKARERTIARGRGDCHGDGGDRPSRQLQKTGRPGEYHTNNRIKDYHGCGPLSERRQLSFTVAMLHFNSMTH